MLTQERLKHLLHYDPETGIWTWRVRRQSVAPGQRAGTVHHSRGKNRNNSSGLKGVFLDKRTGRWRAECGPKYLGMFATKEEAHQAYSRSALEQYGEYANAGT